MEPLPRSLGPYLVTERIGAGGMGEVFRATDTRLKREVAVKVLPTELAGDPDRLARFQREAEAVAALNHPGIVTVHSVERIDGIHILTMELVDGATLDESLPPEGHEATEWLALARSLADALRAAHERGLVHRDLKPGNVMRTRDGRVKVLDFGLAKEAASDTPDLDETRTLAPLTREGMVVGTLPYMSPEQLGGRAVGPASDVFSLGILLYELATGARPFQGATEAELGSAILRDTPPPLTEVRPDFPPSARAIVDRCLAKAPAERYASAAEVLRALELQEAGAAPSPPPSPARPRDTIAVLPFVNVGRDEESEIFANGLAEELLNTLSRSSSLRVTGRTSSFSFQGSEATVAEIGEALQVATLIEGSVRTAGNRIRVAVRVIDVAEEREVWSDTFDDTLDDIFDLQDRIAVAVTRETRAALSDSALSPGPRPTGTDVSPRDAARAHQLYLKANHFTGKRTPEDTERAIGYAREATELDPLNAAAWRLLGFATLQKANYGWVPPDEVVEDAREYETRALEIDPSVEGARTTLAWIQIMYDRDWAGAEATVQEGLEHTPDDPRLLATAATLSSALGRQEEAVEYDRRVLEREPRAAGIHANLGRSLECLDRIEEAIESYREGIRISPRHPTMHGYLGMALAGQGRHEEALASAERETHPAMRFMALAVVHHLAGRAEESEDALSELIAEYGESAAAQVAEAYAARGENREAFEWLDLAIRVKDGGVGTMQGIPAFRNLQDDPGWEERLRAIGLEP